MSFILDALKKSEKERQRDAVPGISDLPVVVHQARTSAWLFAVIAALGACVIALAWAWWRTSSPAPVVAARPPPSLAGEPAERPATAATADAARTTTRSLASEATRVAAAVTVPATISAATTAAPRVLSTAPAAGTITASPISILEARARGMAVPELMLELLVFSSNPAQRFVYINSAKYVEGDSLSEGPQVVEITSEGAILSYRGQDFLLPQN